MGLGFRVGFLGLLHLEIIKERLIREFGLEIVVSPPSPSYKIVLKNKKEVLINNPSQFPPPSSISEILEPYVKLEIITPQTYLGSLLRLLRERRGQYKEMKYLEAGLCLLTYEIPLCEIIFDFYDKLKTLSSGYGSMDYQFRDFRQADLCKIDFLIASKKIAPLSLIAPREKAFKVGQRIVSRLKEMIPRQLFKISIQAAISSKIIAREDIPALGKNVTRNLYGGDISRKRKLWEKQKAGKRRLKKFGRVEIPTEVFLKLAKEGR